MSPTSRTISLLSQHLVILLDLVEPPWQRHPLLGSDIAEVARDILSACGVATLGDLTAIDPLTLLALAAVNPMPNLASEASDAAFWPAIQRAASEHIMRAVERTIVNLIVATCVVIVPHHESEDSTASSIQEPRTDTPRAEDSRSGADGAATDVESDPPDNGYSSLLAKAQDVLDAFYWRLADQPVRLETPSGQCIGQLTRRELPDTPLLARRVREVLRGLGCDLQTTMLDALELPVRTFNTCRRAGIKTLDALARKTPNELLDIRNFGVRSYREVHDGLRRCLAPWLDRVPLDVLVPDRVPGQDVSAMPIEHAMSDADGGVP